MEKVLLWGTGYYYEMWYNKIQFLIDKGRIEILALVSRDEELKIKDGCPIITKEKIKDYNYDHIILTVDTEAVQSIMKDIDALQIPEDKVMSLAEYMKYAGADYYKWIMQKQVKALKDILSASDEEICDYKWMFGKVSEYGIYPYKPDKQRGINWTEYGIIQVIEEFTAYCNFIGTLERIDSAIEIGVYHGRSSYFMCALLSRKNPDLKYVMVDICDHLDSFETFKEILPALEKKIPSTSDDYKGQGYDFVFIDADHTYDAAIRDYLNLGQYAKKLTVFHDIYAHEYDKLNGGTVRMWKEVCELNQGKLMRTFSVYPDKWMGIGCLLPSAVL